MDIPYIVHDEFYKGYRIHIYPDDDLQSPRGWDNLGTMVCWHRKYILGDEMPKISPDEWLCEFARSFTDYEHISCYSERFERLENMTSSEAIKILNENIIILSLYIYDHSGVTMSTHPFSCPWDSGQVGYIYVTKKNVLKDYNRKKMSKKFEKEVLGILESEVSEYNQYFIGDVYGFHILDNGDVIDSCYGYYGLNDCIAVAKQEIDFIIEQ